MEKLKEKLTTIEFWFGVAGIIGVLFGFYAYAANYKTGHVSYVFDTQKVFDPTNLSGFSLITPEQSQIKSPVYATEIVIWNAGDLSLSESSDRVREPLKFTFANARIYYHILGDHNLVDESNYTIEDSPDKNSVTIHWKYFDPGQGLRLTLIHSETGSPNVSVTGRFYETSLSEANSSTKSGPQEDRKRQNGIYLFGATLVGGILFLIVGPLVQRVISKRFPKSRGDIRWVFNMFGGSFIFASLMMFVLFFYLSYTHPIPPI